MSLPVTLSISSWNFPELPSSQAGNFATRNAQSYQQIPTLTHVSTAALPTAAGNGAKV